MGHRALPINLLFWFSKFFFQISCAGRQTRWRLGVENLLCKVARKVMSVPNDRAMICTTNHLQARANIF